MVRFAALRSHSALHAFLAIIVFVVHSFAPLSAAAQAARVKLQIGTPVDLVFDTAVSSETAVVGQQVTLKVASPVLVDGKTVIAAGTPVLGEVVSAKKSGMVGMAGVVSVSVKQVTAVDGTVVLLTGTKALEGKSNTTTSVVVAVVCCVLGLLIKGQKGEIPSGSTVRATVAAPAEIAVQ